MTPQEIISDDEIARVHGNANFGAMDPREVVNDGVRKTAVGYHCGSTQLHILRDHGLVTKPRSGSSDVDLTKKGKAYARSIYRDTTPARAEAQDEGALSILDCLLDHSGARGSFDAMRHGDAVKDAEELLRSARSPGHTDLMVTPESIDAYMRVNPMEAQDEGAAGVIDALIDGEWTAMMGDSPDAYANPASINHDEFAQAIKGVVSAIRAHPSPPPAADEDRVRIAVEALEFYAAGGLDGTGGGVAIAALAALKSTAAKEGGK